MGAVLRVYVKFCVSVVWRMCTPFCVCFCVRVTVKVVLFLKHRLDDSSRKWGYVCVSVFLFTHLMGYTVSRQKQREWTK